MLLSELKEASGTSNRLSAFLLPLNPPKKWDHQRITQNWVGGPLKLLVPFGFPLAAQKGSFCLEQAPLCVQAVQRIVSSGGCAVYMGPCQFWRRWVRRVPHGRDLCADVHRRGAVHLLLPHAHLRAAGEIGISVSQTGDQTPQRGRDVLLSPLLQLGQTPLNANSRLGSVVVCGLKGSTLVSAQTSLPSPLGLLCWFFLFCSGHFLVVRGCAASLFRFRNWGARTLSRNKSISFSNISSSLQVDVNCSMNLTVAAKPPSLRRGSKHPCLMFFHFLERGHAINLWQWDDFMDKPHIGRTQPFIGGQGWHPG